MYQVNPALLFKGDCLEELKKLEDNSVDSVVTDPPYGLAFMGKKWDYDVPPIEVWKECYRVLKPGGFLLSFGGSRTYHRLTVAVEDAGFEIRDQIMWVYGSGFPKSHNVGKAIDKLQGNERVAVGKNPNHRESDALFELGFQGGKGDGTITKGSSDWEGWGTALKPAHEPIVMARKPFKGTVANNVLTYGTGAINIDDCRVGTETISTHNAPKGTFAGGEWDRGSDTASYTEHQGRFPANFIHDGSDEVVSQFPYTKSGKMGPQHTRHTDGSPDGRCYGKFDVNHPLAETPGDEGSAARFFYCPKASKKDRNAGCEHLTEKSKVFNGQSSEPSKDMKGVEQKFTTKPSSNNHPTVKPQALMAYLCRLVTQPGGIVLDPFMGSGSTGRAALAEDFRFIGIEREEEYFNIAAARIFNC